MATMRNTLALIPTLMPAMRPSEMDARTIITSEIRRHLHSARAFQGPTS
jgi:hypothetical protein